MLQSSDFSKAAAATKNVLDVLRELIAARHVTPTDDLASRNIKAQVMGRAVTDDENLSMLFSMYLGGLDTVATAMAWQFHELATNPELQDRLRRNLQQVPAAVDEMLRRFSMVTVRRQAVADYEIAGVSIKAGDWVQMPTTLGSTDPHEYSDPLKVDLDRKGVRHFAFAYGKHFCLGFRLARQELMIAITQWLERLPPLRISDPAGVVFHGGQSVGLRSLPLTWT
jgi:cytochrome P450